MALSVNLLSTDDKTTLRTQLEERKAQLEFSKLSFQIRKDKTEETATNLDADIASTQAEVDAYTNILAGATAGTSLYIEMERRKRQAENKLWALNDRKSRFGTIAIVRIESQIEELNARISMLNDHIAQLA